MENKCLVCGAIIPEGRQVCPTCKKGGKHEISKKLTDEQIELETYLHSFEEGDNITVTCDLLNAMEQALDLIHRLQGEVQRLAKVEMEFIGKIAEQKAEIERLKEQCSKSSYKDSWKNKFFKAKAEIERLTEELDLANETIDRNNKRYERVSIERQKALDRVDYLEDALLDKIRRNEELITAIKQAEQQAVKDTAKEILDEVSKHFGGAWLVELYKRYGLEVE